MLIDKPIEDYTVKEMIALNDYVKQLLKENAALKEKVNRLKI